MARGWESKSVEEQQAAAVDSLAVVGPPLTADETEAAQAVGTLRLARARLLADLQTACRPAHRATLEAALAEVEARLGAAETSG
jgi:hypothetical protein